MTKANTDARGDAAFSAAKMFEELALGPPRILTGAVKKSDKIKSFLFSKSSDCKEWSEIAEEIVLRYEYVGEAKCEDHTHSIVRLYLKPPATDSERAFLMADHSVPSSMSALADIQASLIAAIAPLSPLGGWYPPKGNCVRNQYGQWVDRNTGLPCA